jgi:ABC transporter substrate binding protein (PQQ-dependent alcohol dehydrogenase system)
MINRALACFLLALSASGACAEDVNVLYVDRQGDPFYAPRQGYAGTYDATRPSAFAGSELGMRDANVIGSAVDKTFILNHLTLTADESARDAIAQRMKDEKDVALILDLPAADMLELGGNDPGVAMFDIRERSDALREQTCKASLFHVLPSDAMIADALAQYLKLMNWTRVLLLASSSPADEVQASAFTRAADKFGLQIVEQRKFVAGNDPNQRDENNPKLITGGVDYDVIYIADETGDFSRTLPYRTYLARPVLGASGLTAAAWHSGWERNGAPQLNRRFFKAYHHVMTDESWAAWVAVSSIVEATIHLQPNVSLTQQLIDPATSIDIYKGYPGSYRDWDHQLRQGILLGTAEAVIGLAPVEGALHESNNLDTLGFDKPEFHCGN